MSKTKKNAPKKTGYTVEEYEEADDNLSSAATTYAEDPTRDHLDDLRTAAIAYSKIYNAINEAASAINEAAS